MANQGSQIGGGKPARLEVLQGLVPVDVGCGQLPVRCGDCGVFAAQKDGHGGAAGAGGDGGS